MRDGRLSKEHFELIKEALKEEKNTDSASSPRKRRKVRQNEEPVIVISDSSDGELLGEDRAGHAHSVEHSLAENVEEDEDEDEDDEYDSDDFEDVTDVGVDQNQELSITISNTGPTDSNKRGRKTVSPSSGVSPAIRQYRKTCHIFVLLSLLCHTYRRNEWCNDEKLQTRLSKMVPDEMFNNLHPPKDEEMPLRSTRKLLDALRGCLKLWNSRFKIGLSSPYEITHLYMISWDSVLKKSALPVSFKTWRKFLTKMQGPLNVSVQGFVTMLRGCGLNARLIHNVQAPDFTDRKVYPKRMKWKLENECLKYPIYWCEVWDKFSKQWITVDVVGQEMIEQVRNRSKLEPVGRIHSSYNMMRYVIAFDRKLGCKDVSRRYISHLQNKVRKKRITKEKELNGWYTRVIEKLNKRKKNRADDYEDEYFEKRNENEGIPDSLQDIKNHPYFVLEKDLRSNQVLRSGAQHCGFLRLRNKANSILKVYSRRDVISCYSGRHWYMQGRVLKPGAQHLMTHKVKNALQEEQEERLYSLDQTEYFIPKQVDIDGKIPTNVYGNIDVYKPWMIPIGCCLVENGNSIKAASFLRIPFAKAVTGFKFETGRRVKPKISGVVVENKYVDAMCCAIQNIEEFIEENERNELELDALNGWSLLLSKLRIKSKLVERHGAITDDDHMALSSYDQYDVSDDYDNQEEAEKVHVFEEGGFFPDPDQDPHLQPTDLNEDENGGFIHEPQEEDVTPQQDEEGNKIQSFKKSEIINEDFENFLQEVGSGSESDGSYHYESE